MIEKHIDVLNSEEALNYATECESIITEELRELIMGGARICREKAVDHFREAYKNVKEVNHKKGKYLAKLHELSADSNGLDLNDVEKV